MGRHDVGGSRLGESWALHPRVIRPVCPRVFQPPAPSPGVITSPRWVPFPLTRFPRPEAKPLMCICFKPAVLFPEAKPGRRSNQPIRGYKVWEKLIFKLDFAITGNKATKAGCIGKSPTNRTSARTVAVRYRFKPDNYVRSDNTPMPSKIYRPNASISILHSPPQFSDSSLRS